MLTTAVLGELAMRIKRGAALLDRKAPGWRRIMRKHEQEFHIQDGSCCILGTLEHYNGLRHLKLRAVDKEDNYRFTRALNRLKLHDHNDELHGFDAVPYHRRNGALADLEDGNSEMYDAMQALWKAEFADPKARP